MTEKNVTQETCEKLREKYKPTEGLDPLQNQFKLDVHTLRYHLYGNCEHNSRNEPITPPVQQRVSATQCKSYRKRVRGGEDPHRIVDTGETYWQTLVRHLSGECQHEIDIPPIDESELYKRNQNVTADICQDLRRSYHEKKKDVLKLAQESDYTYQTVLRHVNGNCSHDIDVEPRSVNERGENIDLVDCKEIRNLWFADPDISFEDVAKEFGCSISTVKRHIKFNCHHPQPETLADEMPEFEDILSSSDTDGFDREAILEHATVNIDVSEAGVDVVSPETVQMSNCRVVRNTEAMLDLKEAYEYQCQVCGKTLKRDYGSLYAEGHHLQPVSPPHNGPDIPANILILCPNHHADFDYGVIAIDPDSYTVRHNYDDSIDGSSIKIIDQHEIDKQYIKYHAEEVSEISFSNLG